MTPRRPAPARPGARAGTRPSRSSRTGSTASGAGRQSSGGSTGPTSNGGAGRGAGSRGTGTAGPGGQSAASRAEELRAPEPSVLRLGGVDGIAIPARALILILVLLLAFIVTFPSLRGYLAQQAQYDAVKTSIARAQATATALEDELARWNDDTYVTAQARERLSYVLPGETTYVVVGADQVAEDSTGTTAGGSGDSNRTPWYETLQESARIAGAVDTQATDPAQQGWSTSMPTVPTPGSSSSPSPRPSADPSETPTPTRTSTPTRPTSTP